MLEPRDIEAVAARVAELLRDDVPFPREGLVSAEEVAQLLGVERTWVYEHKLELGVVRIGDGPRGVLRFEAASVLAYIRGRRLGEDEPAPPERPGPRRRGTRSGGLELLPLPSEAA